LQKAKLIKKTELAPGVFELNFQTENLFEFIPGQYVSIKINDKKSSVPCFRAYSISSTPNENHFELCVKTVENGRGSTWLSGLGEGSEIEFMGPLGDFTLKDDGASALLFLAVGIGITPLKSIVESALNKNSKKTMHLFFGVRYIKDIFYKDFFEALEKAHLNFKFTFMLSRPESPAWQGPKGHITDLLKDLAIDPQKTSAYICGMNQMIKDTEKTLIEKGVPAQRIYFEKFD